MSKRLTRESDDYPSFPQPPDPSIAVWRYMNFPKFVSLLQNGLYFSRVDYLGDAWEGVLPKTSTQFLAAAADAIVKIGGEKLLPEIAGSWKESFGAARERTFASCWQAATADLWWMWKVYCGNEYGVAIRSSYERLDAALPAEFESRPILLGLVRYGDYASDDYVTDPSDVLASVMSKRDAFQDEREVRALCDFGMGSKDKVGIFVPIDINAFAAAIVVSPLSPQWFRATVEATTRALNCSVPVEHSRLRALPSRPFE